MTKSLKDISKRFSSYWRIFLSYSFPTPYILTAIKNIHKELKKPPSFYVFTNYSWTTAQINFILKAHSQIWGNIWQLKALKND